MTVYNYLTRTFEQLGTQEEITAINTFLQSNPKLNHPYNISAHANDDEPHRICISFSTDVYSPRTILAQIKAGHKIQAIKQFRSLMDDPCLKTAKQAIEILQEIFAATNTITN